MPWSRHSESCRQCTTTRFKHKAKGLCIRCYSLVRQTEVIQHWDLLDRTTLKGYPKNSAMWTQKTLEWTRKHRLQSIKSRLSHYRYREETLRGEVDGHLLACQFDRVAELAGSKACFSRGGSNRFDWDYTPEQKKKLFSILNEIEETSSRRIFIG